MREIFKKINADKIIRLGTNISVGLMLLQFGLIMGFYFYLPPFLPLYNQMPWGQERVGTKIEIFLPLLITITFFCLNILLAVKIYEKMPLLSRILSITSLLISILTFIFIIQTIQLVL